MTGPLDGRALALRIVVKQIRRLAERTHTTADDLLADHAQNTHVLLLASQPRAGA